jgi:hypothetical protein
VTREAPRRKVPRWVIVAAIVLAFVAVTRMLVQQRAQRKALRDAALVSASPGSQGERDAALAIAPDGRAVVAWTVLGAGAATGERIGLRALVRGSHAWGEPTSVASPEPLRAGPVLASAADGTTWLAFAGTHVLATHAAPSTLDFAAPAPVGGGEGRSGAAPALAATGDAAWLVFREDDGPGKPSRVVLRALRSAGPAEPTTLAEGSAVVGALPTVCADGERAVVAWLDPTRGIVLSGHDTTGARATDVLVSAKDEAIALETPQCTVRGDEVIVLYGLAAAPVDPTSSTPLAALVLARSTDRGRTFTARTRVEEPGLALLHPAMAREASGTTALVYYAGRTEPDAFAAFRWRRVPVVGGPADDGRVARAPMHLAPRRGDAKWAGEHVVAAAGAGLLGAAFVDNLEGTHVAFVELGPWLGGARGASPKRRAASSTSYLALLEPSVPPGYAALRLGPPPIASRTCSARGEEGGAAAPVAGRSRSTSRPLRRDASLACAACKARAKSRGPRGAERGHATCSSIGA